jgi:hypothetical protein
VRGPSAAARAKATAAQSAHPVLLIGGHLVDRRDDGSGQRIGLLPGMDRERLESVGVLTLHIVVTLPQ